MLHAEPAHEVGLAAADRLEGAGLAALAKDAVGLEGVHGQLGYRCVDHRFHRLILMLLYLEDPHGERHGRLVVMAGLGGHGFKMAPALGEGAFGVLGDLKAALSKRYDVPAEWITLGNGSNDILEIAAGEDVG